MTHVFSLLSAVGAEPDGVNLWGMLGCALTYAAALFAAVDGVAEHLLQRDEPRDPRSVHAMRIKTVAKLAAAAIAVLTAAIVLILDNNWAAFTVLSIVFIAIVAWVFLVYRASTRDSTTAR